MSKDAALVLRDTGAIEHYDHEQGLKTVALAEVAEKYYRRAKDAERLYEAVEAKLTEQRKFVIWWDQQEKAAGAREPGTNRGTTPLQTGNGVDLVAGQDGVPDRIVIHRWRARLVDKKKFDVALEGARERCRRVCEAEKGSTEQKGASGTGENEWYTPIEYVEAARDVLGAIDVDPASSEAAQKSIKAEAYFTKADNGLDREWNGRVWLNPPYEQPHIADFVTKLVREVSIGRTSAAVLLTHNYTDTAWFHEAASIATAICFTRGRVKFYSPSGEVAAPTQGQAFFYFGNEVERFRERFMGIGFVAFLNL